MRTTRLAAVANAFDTCSRHSRPPRRSAGSSHSERVCCRSRAFGDLGLQPAPLVSAPHRRPLWCLRQERENEHRRKNACNDSDRYLSFLHSSSVRPPFQPITHPVPLCAKRASNAGSHPENQPRDDGDVEDDHLDASDKGLGRVGWGAPHQREQVEEHGARATGSSSKALGGAQERPSSPVHTREPRAPPMPW